MAPKLYSEDLFNDTPPVKVEKKPRTEKQIAAFEKAKATREANKAAKLAEESAAKKAEEDVRLAAEEVTKKAAAKKAAAAEKRRLAKEAKTQVSLPSPVATEEEIPAPPPPKKKRKEKVTVAIPEASSLPPVQPEGPPKWFTDFYLGAKMEKEKDSGMTKKQMKEEAVVESKESWKQPVVRDRVHEEIDRHLTSLHNQIFKKRKF